MRVLFLLLVLTFTGSGCRSTFVQEYWPARSAHTGVPESELRTIAAAAEAKHKMAVVTFEREGDAVLVYLTDRTSPPHRLIALFRRLDGIWQEVASREGWTPANQAPNKSPEPTIRPVTIRAEPRIAPGRIVAHL